MYCSKAQSPGEPTKMDLEYRNNISFISAVKKYNAVWPDFQRYRAPAKSLNLRL